jgi:hypothetical protein
VTSRAPNLPAHCQLLLKPEQDETGSYLEESFTSIDILLTPDLCHFLAENTH